MTQASVLINQCAEAVGDLDMDDWTSDQWIAALNAAIDAVISVKSDAYIKRDNIPLVEGTEQTLPADGLRLMDISHNMGGGTSPGNVITRAQRDALDRYDPAWHSAATASAIDQFVVDDRDPTKFWVTPPAQAVPTLYVSALYSAKPTAIAADTDTIPLNANYHAALREWMLYLAFGRDDDSTPNFSKSQQHKATFFELLGAKSNAEKAYSPRNPEHHR